MSLLQFLFGKNNRTVLASLDVDCTLSESHQSSSDVTMNPVESGVPVTDHIQPKPKVFSIEGIFSDSPVTLLGELGNFLTGGGSRVAEALNFFQGLADNPELIDIVTPIRTYSSMALQTLTFPRNVQTGQALYFNATFIEVRIVETQEVTLAIKNIQQKAKLGKQAPKTPSTSAQKKAGSVLTRITGFGG